MRTAYLIFNAGRFLSGLTICRTAGDGLIYSADYADTAAGALRLTDEGAAMMLCDFIGLHTGETPQVVSWEVQA